MSFLSNKVYYAKFGVYTFVMRIIKHVLITVSVVSWLACVACFAVWARLSQQAASTGWISGFPVVVAAIILIIIFLILLWLSSQRLAILSIMSLAFATLLIAAWIGSAHVWFNSQYAFKTRWTVIGGIKCSVETRVRAAGTHGGIGMEYQCLNMPEEPDRELFDSDNFVIAKTNPFEFPTYPGFGVSPTLRSYKPIPRWGGFDSSWYRASVPTVGWQSQYSLVVPLWLPLLLCGFFPALYARKLQKKRRFLREGRCVCGYQLTGTPASPDGTRRCSECGRVNPPSAVVPPTVGQVPTSK